MNPTTCLASRQFEEPAISETSPAVNVPGNGQHEDDSLYIQAIASYRVDLGSGGLLE